MSARRLRPRWLGDALCLTVALALLAACGSSGNTPDNRIFANDAGKQTIPATETPPPTQVMPPTPTATPPPSPALLLTARGAPSRFYVAVGGHLVEIGAGGTARQLPLPAQAELLGLDWSPNGEQVAIATGQRDRKTGNTAVSLLVIAQDGKTVRSVANLFSLPAARGTPAVASQAPRVLVDWGLIGNQVAVATANGGLALVPPSGKVRSLTIDLKGQAIRAMRISPRGDSVGLLTVDAAGRGTVSLASLTDTQSPAPRALVGYGVDRQHSITAFAWLSDGQHVLYTQADPGADPRTGGELYSMTVKTREQRLIDTGGRAGPAAGIVAFAPSPDGKTIAYVIGVREVSGWVANSLWVRSLRGGATMPVPIGNADQIDGLWWTTAGLVWATSSGTDVSGAYSLFYFVQPPHGAAHELVRITVKHGAPATPGATPIASPVASPAATPGASPVATPRR